jgi:hypothetical protein
MFFTAAIEDYALLLLLLLFLKLGRKIIIN